MGEQETVFKPMFMFRMADKTSVYMMKEEKHYRVGSSPDHNDFVIQDNSVEMVHAHITCLPNKLVIFEPQYGASYVSDVLKVNNERYEISCIGRLLKFRFGTIDAWVWYEELMPFVCDQCSQIHYRPFDEFYIDVSDSNNSQEQTI